MTTRRKSAGEVELGHHRRLIGDLWEEMGQKQLDFLIGEGLRPEHKLLDVGCGALRGGLHFIRYLDVGNYVGIDINQSLLDAGYEIELAQCGLKARMPRENLICSGDFERRSPMARSTSHWRNPSSLTFPSIPSANALSGSPGP